MDDSRVKTIASLFFVILIAAVIALDVFFNPKMYQTEGQKQTPLNDNQNQAGIILIRTDNQNINAIEQNNGNSSVINTNVNSVPVITHILTTDLLNASGINNATIEDAKAGKELFSIRLETIAGDILKRYVRQDDFPLGIVYEVDPTVSYDALKTGLREKVAASPVWQINETNTFGNQSFYLNNSNRSDTIFLIIDFNGQVLGFEYPRANHPKFQAIFGQLGKV